MNDDKPWNEPRAALDWAREEIARRGYTVLWTESLRSVVTVTSEAEWHAARSARSLAELDAWRARQKARE